MVNRTLSAVDYVLLVLLLLASALIGVIFGVFKSKKNSAKEFLLGIEIDLFSFVEKDSICSLF